LPYDNRGEKKPEIAYRDQKVTNKQTNEGASLRRTGEEKEGGVRTGGFGQKGQKKVVHHERVPTSSYAMSEEGDQLGRRKSWRGGKRAKNYANKEELRKASIGIYGENTEKARPPKYSTR